MKCAWVVNSIRNKFLYNMLVQCSGILCNDSFHSRTLDTFALTESDKIKCTVRIL